MSRPSSQLELEATHNNQFLFSNHYLNNRLPRRDEWAQGNEYEIGLIMEQLQQRWHGIDPDGLNEAQTEERWIKPVLDALGHSYSVQVSIETPRSVRQPDYVIARDADAKANLRGVLTEDELSNALAVADAKKWGRDLDAKGTEESRLSSVPTLQIDFYLRYSGLNWGILTNGRKWRLFHTDTSHKLEVFYEVDLPQLLEQGSSDAFKYFYFFFRREAFEGDPSFLERVLNESKAYEHGISDDLKEQVYDALVALSQGFFDLESNDLSPDEQTIQLVHDNSLIILYRLLFLLFAESRELLPMGNRQYRDRYSLEHLKGEIRDQLEGAGVMGIAGATNHWSYLQNLWRFVDEGQDELDIPPYNGGLFDPEEHPFLEEYEVGDRHLAKAIDLLGRAEDPRTGTREFVDYRDLDVRHLGSIYEGLLEYKLSCADKPLKVDSSGEYVKAEEEEQAAVSAGEVYLITDKGERKASGSYYTPDYIVQYIVEHTVGPVLEELRADHVDGDGELYDREQLVEKILDVNVLDPAMGSGHFLVAVTDYIGRFLVEVSPEIDTSDEDTELAHWRRRVAQACIYGVDINPLAVELAKLSLWLRTVAKDKPLSFLDHHLRCGNSLVGARVDELPLEPQQTSYQKRKERTARKAGQASLMDTQEFQEAMKNARGLMRQIEDIAGDQLEDVREAADLYNELVEQHTKTPQLLGNVVMAQSFGLEMGKEFLNEMLPRIRDGRWKSVPRYRRIVEVVEDLAEKFQFFHWELEFPEVFFGEEGNINDPHTGFAAIIGNPPYINIKQQAKPLSDFLRTRHDGVYGRADLSVSFALTAVELLRPSGYLGYITTNKFLHAQYGEPFKENIVAKGMVEEIVDLSNAPVFDDPTAYPCLFHFRKNGEDRESKSPRWPSGIGRIHASTKVEAEQKLRNFDVDCTANSITPEQLQIATRPLRYYAGTIREGSANGKDSVFIMNRKEAEASGIETACLRPILYPDDVDAYWSRCPVPKLALWPYDDDLELVDLETYPGLANYCRKHRDTMADRYVVRETGKEFYAYHDPAFTTLTKGRKLVVPDIAIEPQFAFARGEVLAKNTLYVLEPSDTVNEELLLGILNSQLCLYFMEQISPKVRGGYLRFKTKYLEKLPIPSFDFGPSLENADWAWLTSHKPIKISSKVEEMPDKRIASFIASGVTSLIQLKERRHELECAQNPFKYLHRGASVEKFQRCFREEIKFANQIFELGRVHHDLDDIALKPSGDCWELHVQLKKRDPECEWEDWLKDGRNIVREWVAAYRFPEISDRKAIYYKVAFEVFDEFDQTGSFPGGKTRTTKKKLDLIEIPEFDEDVDLDALVELSKELAEVEAEIENTEELIDQLVYQLYGLTDEEVAIVEDKG